MGSGAEGTEPVFSAALWEKVQREQETRSSEAWWQALSSALSLSFSPQATPIVQEKEKEDDGDEVSYLPVDPRGDPPEPRSELWISLAPNPVPLLEALRAKAAELV